MAKFSEQLSQTDVKPRVFTHPVDKSAGSGIRGLQSMMEGGLDIKDKITKANFAEEMAGVTVDEQAYLEQSTAAKDELVGGLTAKDAGVVEQARAKLISLERGEINGSLTRAAATTRRRALLAQQVADTPWLAPELRALAATSGSSGGAGYGSSKVVDPLQAEIDVRESVNKLAVSMAISPLALQHQAKLKAEAEIGSLIAAKNFPALQNSLQAQAVLSRQAITQQVLQASVADPTSIDKADIGVLVQNEKSRLFGELSKKKAEMAAAGIFLSEDKEKMLRSQIDSEMSALQGLVDSKDKAAYLKRMRQMMDDGAAIDAQNYNPAFARLTHMYGSEGAAKYMAASLKYNRAIMQGQGVAMIEKMISGDNPDSDAMMFMEVMKLNLPQWYPDMFKNMGMGTQLTNKHLEAYKQGLIGQMLGDPDIKPDDPMTPRLHDELTKSDNPSEIAQYLKPDVFAKTIGDKKAVAKLERAITFNLPGVVDGVRSAVERAIANPTRQPSSLRLDPSRAASLHAEGKTPSQPTETAPTISIQNGVFVADGLDRDPNVRILNQYSELVKKYGLTKLQEWQEDILVDINSGVGLPQEAGESAPKAEEKKPKHSYSANPADQAKSARPVIRYGIGTTGGFGVKQ